MKIPFTKMQGCGNDFVVIDGRKDPKRPWNDWAKRLLDRRMGVGGDTLLVLLPTQQGDVKVGIFERDGLESESCGNGMRCIARYLAENEGKKGKILLDTLGGLRTAEIANFKEITVDMGKPTLDSKIWGKKLRIEDWEYPVYSLSMGNPHAVIFLNRPEDLGWVQTLGPTIERHTWFPQRTNVEFVFIPEPKNAQTRVWERGAGETFACGSGASALAVAAIKEGKAQSPLRVHFKGGTLQITWKEGETVWMTGDAERVFEGMVEL